MLGDYTLAHNGDAEIKVATCTLPIVQVATLSYIRHEFLIIQLNPDIRELEEPTIFSYMQVLIHDLIA